MKKTMLLVLMVGCLLSCHTPVDLYTGRLNKVEYFSVGGWGSFESWVLTFEDGQIFTIKEQPRMGFRIGDVYIIYENKDGYYRVKKGD